MPTTLYPIILTILLLLLGFIAGSINEKRHYRSIKERERRLLHLPAVTVKKETLINPQGKTVSQVELVTGSVVVALDYFKMMTTALRKIIGGNVRACETLIDRARREAILRMKEAAGDADIIANVRLETSTIGNKSNNFSGVEVIAYGSALTFHP